MKSIGLRVYVSIVAVLSLAIPASMAVAEDDDPKPFADVRVVLQLSDQERESVVLDVANNLIKNYGSRPKLSQHAQPVTAGVARMIEKVTDG